MPQTPVELQGCNLVSEGSTIPFAKMTDTEPTKEHPSARRWMLWAGWLLFVLGAIGIVLPILPTTIFWICAVWLWSRSSPHLTERILRHPRFGPPILLFIERGEMSRQGKLAATSGIILSFILMQLLARPTWPMGLAVGLLLATVIIWLWLRPEPSNQTEEE